MTDEVWPERVRLRDTKLHDDMSGAGQRIYTTAGRGYTKIEYIRADIAEAEIERLKNLLGDPEGTIAHADSITSTSEAEIERLRARLAEAEPILTVMARAANEYYRNTDDETRIGPFGLTLGHLRAARTWKEQGDA